MFHFWCCKLSDIHTKTLILLSVFEWLAAEFISQGISEVLVNAMCIQDDYYYVLEGTNLIYTCVMSGEYWEICPSDIAVCSGKHK